MDSLIPPNKLKCIFASMEILYYIFPSYQHTSYKHKRNTISNTLVKEP